MTTTGIAMQHGNPMALEMMVAMLVLGLVPFGIITAHMLYFITLPNQLAGGTATTRERRRKALERIAATPSLGRTWRVPALLHLLRIHVEQERHREVVATCRLLLALGRRRPVVSIARGHLADSLEALGDPDAAEERVRALEAAVDGDPSNAIEIGRLLDHEHRFDEAYAAYNFGLEHSPGPAELRAKLLLRMSLSAFNAGRSEDSAFCAERAIAEGAEGLSLRSAHRQAANTLKELGRLDEAESHARKGRELSIAECDPKEMAQSAAGLAEILRVRGRLDEALRMCDSAVDIDESNARVALVIRYEILKNLGRFDEARNAIARARGTFSDSGSFHEGRSRAILSMAEACLSLIAGRPDEAEAKIDEARPALENDPKLSILLVAGEARIAALRGDREAYAAAVEHVEEGLEAFTDSPSMARGSLDSLGRAAVDIGDLEYGAGCWERYLMLRPQPVDRPTALYYLGLCQEGLGRLSEARQSFRKASESGIVTHHARLARQRTD